MIRPRFFVLFLKTGITIAVTHSEGSFPVWIDFSKVTSIIGAISFLSSISNKSLSLSGHAAFPGFRFLGVLRGH